MFIIFNNWHDFYEATKSFEKKLFLFLASFNLCISFENFSYATAKLMDTFVFSQAILLKRKVYHNNTKISLLTIIDHIKAKIKHKNFVMSDPLNLFWYALLSPKMTQSRIRTHFFFGHDCWTTSTKFP